jgi:hypothetical protein
VEPAQETLQAPELGGPGGGGRIAGGGGGCSLKGSGEQQVPQSTPLRLSTVAHGELMKAAQVWLPTGRLQSGV